MAERDKKGRFVNGHKKLAGAGRKKGTPNKATREWKEYVTALVSDPDNQEVLAQAIRQRPDLLFKAAEQPTASRARRWTRSSQGPLRFAGRARKTPEGRLSSDVP